MACHVCCAFHHGEGEGEDGRDGEQRTFLEPVVQLGFARRLHRPGYEYFVVTDQRRPRPELLKIAPVRAWIAGGLVGDITGHGDHSGCAANTCNSHRFLYPAMERLSHCYPAIQNEEGRRGMRYEFLLRVRPDHPLHPEDAPAAL